MKPSTLLSFSLTLLLPTTTLAVDPDVVYNGGVAKDTDPILLRIGNGGAGQSGLVGALANAFIKSLTSSKSSPAKPFRVAWYKSDTTYTINYLSSDTVDVGITYSPAAEGLAIKQGIALSPSYYIFRDHFLLVGPKSNPAGLKTGDKVDILDQFADLYHAAQFGNNSVTPTRFLSRYDKSATNIKDSELFIRIGQVPWATAYSTWYHQYIAFPIQALTASILLQEYTITDRGTLLTLKAQDKALAEKAVVYKAASDDEDDLLLNPAHLLIGKGVKNGEYAKKFADWCVGEEGQKVVTTFKQAGEVLYSGAPKQKVQTRMLRWQRR